ncbi:receptor expression-enhancing protein 4-like isoform X3 [Osmia bicornis bicornis]|uniref:receptor expression-enhancing protein 4-like isoform X3 n=1 Tax=Osmia bicornis bicornis TaxID=1437191 RepID=UPI001EAE92EB|nr:receptor expression-enhancing protein 4-like isoform X3 [Osmia bicornis bicornis]
MISSVVSRLVILVFGNLYPAYASYKAVRTKNVKEYVKWMMYWIVFALFTCAETFTDVFFSFWFPFYYEIKTILVVWLLSPATKGSSILYRRFVHPALIRREAEIDDALARATEQGYTAVLHLGTKGVNYATTVLMQTAIKGGGGLVQHLKKSYSLSDLTGEKEDENRNTPHMHDETDMEVEPRRREHVGRRSYSPRRTQSSSNRVEMYFSEVDVDVRQPRSREPTASLTNIRSSDDISSGYSSGEALQSTRTLQGDSLVRTSSVGARTRAKPRSATKKTTEDSGEDTDGNDPHSSTNISFPSPLTRVTPEQALEILLLLSQNSNVADYIKLDRGLFLAGNNDHSHENTSQSGPQSCGKESESIEPVSVAEVQIIQSIETKTVAEHPLPISSINNDAQVEQIKLKDEEIEAKITDVPSTAPEDSVDDSNRTVSDELCQNKFDELKQLLSDARKAVNSIVHTQESSVTEITVPEKDSSSNVDIKEVENTEDVKITSFATLPRSKKTSKKKVA